MRCWVIAAIAVTSPLLGQTFEFEAVSVKPCGQTTPPPGEGGGRRGNVPRAASPDRLFLGCMTARRLVIQAMMNATSDSPWNFHGFAMNVEGGPSWFDSDRYT